MQFKSAPDDGQNVTRNMLSSVLTIKDFTTECASGWLFYLRFNPVLQVVTVPTNAHFHCYVFHFDYLLYCHHQEAYSNQIVSRYLLISNVRKNYIYIAPNEQYENGFI
jgi:hypothetical protein